MENKIQTKDKIKLEIKYKMIYWKYPNPINDNLHW